MTVAQPRVPWRPVILVLVAISFAACGGQSGDVRDSAPVTDSLTIPGDPSSSVGGDLPPTAAAYMSAFVRLDRQALNEMVELAEPGTPARDFAIHHRAFFAVIRPERFPHPQVEFVEDGVVMSSPSNSAASSTTYADFEIDPRTGRLVTFSVDGEAIDGQLSRGGRPQVDRGVGVDPVSAYERESFDLIVVVDTTNRSGRIFRPNAARVSYLTPDGQRLNVATIDGPAEVRPGRTVRFVASFLGAALGGTLRLTGLLDGATSTVVALDIDIPASP